MKKLTLIFFSLLMCFIISCKEQKNSELYGNWKIFHLFENGEELLGNNYDKNGWDVPGYKTTDLNILKAENSVNIYIDRERPPISANFEFLNKNDSLKIRIKNSTKENFNGIYSIELSNDTIQKEGLSIVYFYLILESDQNAILAVKNKVLDPS